MAFNEEERMETGLKNYFGGKRAEKGTQRSRLESEDGQGPKTRGRWTVPNASRGRTLKAKKGSGFSDEKNTGDLLNNQAKDLCRNPSKCGCVKKESAENEEIKADTDAVFEVQKKALFLKVMAIR